LPGTVASTAQRSSQGGEAGRPDASAIGAPPLTARTPWYGEGNSKTALPLAAIRRQARRTRPQWPMASRAKPDGRDSARGAGR